MRTGVLLPMATCSYCLARILVWKAADMCFISGKEGLNMSTFVRERNPQDQPQTGLSKSTKRAEEDAHLQSQSRLEVEVISYLV